MKRLFACAVAAFAVGGLFAKDVDVLCIYYPEWHVYPEGEMIFGRGRTEWDLIDSARPRFMGHEMPIRLRDGHPDDANPQDVAKEIDYAADAGIDCFLYDWYWANGHPIQHEALEQGFLKAPNRGRMKFALMWAYHDRNDVFRAPPGKTARRYFWKLKRTPEEFRETMRYAVTRYFAQTNYYRKGGRFFYSIYNSPVFVNDMGGAEKTRVLLAEFPNVHFNAMVLNAEEAGAVADAGFASQTAYGVNPYAFYEYPESGVKAKGRQLFTYAEFAAVQAPFNTALAGGGRLPHLPVVARGWDASARCALDEPFPWKKMEFPYLPIVERGDPAIFARLVRDAVARARADPKRPGAILINAWNEYSEGSYLMPDVRCGDAFLRSLKDALATP